MRFWCALAASVLPNGVRDEAPAERALGLLWQGGSCSPIVSAETFPALFAGMH